MVSRKGHSGIKPCSEALALLTLGCAVAATGGLSATASASEREARLASAVCVSISKWEACSGYGFCFCSAPCEGRHPRAHGVLNNRYASCQHIHSSLLLWSEESCSDIPSMKESIHAVSVCSGLHTLRRRHS